MADYQREIYQPSFEDGPTYDLQDDEVEDARARLPLLIVIALLVLAAFAGVVWLAYNQGVERGRIDTPTVIAAPAGPIRTAPDQQGGDAPLTGLKIYNEPVPPDRETETSTLAQNAPAAGAVVNAPPAPPVPAVAAPAPAIASAPVRAPAPVGAPIPGPAATSATASAAVSAVSGGAVLQIGAFPSETLATDAWQNFRTSHPQYIAGLGNDIQQVDLGERGIWYRLRIGPFTDDAAANATCSRLKTEGGDCFVAAP